jgi:SAM-dependent methyltransferase
MQREGWRVTAAFEEHHWWFRARRVLLLHQVERAVREAGCAPGSARLLDYGCGTGFNLPLLAGFGESWAADVSGPEAAPLRRLAGAAWIDLGSDLTPHHGRFDVLTALDVLEHLDDDVDGLRTMRALLRPRGQILLTVPAYDWLWGGEDVISEHRRRYTRRSLERACRGAGLRPCFVSYFNLAILPGAAAVVWSDRALRRPPRSNLRAAPAWLGASLYRISALEARWVGCERLRLPAGASLVARCASEDPS